MGATIAWLDSTVGGVPISLLEVWGRFSYLVGAGLAFCAFGGFTFRIGERWGLGREQYAWNTRAFLSVPLTFVLVIASGYAGSFIVLVPGAQTFESLKDLVVLLCIVYFGYPALLAVPPAYMLSDLIEGVPPSFVLDWAEGYFFWAAFVWMALQLFGREPDFRRPRTWGSYAVFVALIMFLDPVMWGYICSGKFPAAVSYLNITSALFFTLAITWLLAPFAFLATLPIAKRLGWFWAEIPGHVRARWVGQHEWIWESGRTGLPDTTGVLRRGLPIRVFIFLPFILLVLVMVGLTATIALRAAAVDADRMAAKLHQEISDNVRLELDEFLAHSQAQPGDGGAGEITELLRGRDSSAEGRAFIFDARGVVIASSAPAGDPVVTNALAAMSQQGGEGRGDVSEFRFDHVTAKPLARDTWLAHATWYPGGSDRGWTLVTAMPESYYLAGVRAGLGRSAALFALALVLSLMLAAALASFVTAPLRRIAGAAGTMARGNLDANVSGGNLVELAGLAESFNDMAKKLKRSFDELRSSEARARSSEDRLQLAIDAGGFGIWDYDVETGRLVWDNSMYRVYGIAKSRFTETADAWARCVVPEDRERAMSDVRAALNGERKLQTDFRVRRDDGAVRMIRGEGQVIRDADGKALRMVGINWDVTDVVNAQREHEEFFRLRTLEELRDALVHMIVHDMGQPLTAALARLDVIKLTGGTRSSESNEDLDAAIQALLVLKTMTHDLLDISRLEAGRMPIDLAICDVSRLVIEVCAELALSTPDRHLLAETPGPIEIPCDESLIRRVIENLASNGIKHTPEGSQLRISVARVAQRVRVEVRDNGAGVAPDDRARIFEKFGTIEARHRHGYHSVGLGLAFCKLAIEAHRGSIGVDPCEPSGSVFWFELPA